MPAFQPLASSSKRKHEGDDSEAFSRKRNMATSNPEHTGLFIEKNFDQIWIAQWRKPQYKKHKTWDGDAVLAVNGNLEAMLYNSDGQSIGTGKVTLPLHESKNFSIGSREIELERQIPKSQFFSGECFGRSASSTVTETTLLNNKPTKQFRPPSFTSNSQVLQPSDIQGRHSVPGLSKVGDQTSEINPSTSSTERLSELTNRVSHWTANWRKPQDRKNKTWDGDAYVSLLKDKLVMISEDGKIMGSTSWKGHALYSGFSIFIGGKEVELDAEVSASLLPDVKGSLLGEQDREATEDLSSVVISVPVPESNQRFVAPVNFYAQSAPRAKAKGPLHDPQGPDALVLKNPTKEHIKRYNKKNLPVVPVVVDPVLSRRMRPHQKEGVSFLYECVMGLRKHEGQGCILADEMGLGKTLQTISLVWTLLRQNPYAAPLPAVQKVLIVCPVSLINNWKSEFHKWLGRDRVGILTCDKNNSVVDLFGRSKAHQVLIIGYERLRTVINKLADIYPPIGLIVCDEGHRLKSANNKTAAMFKALNTRRRIILSGTPIQNDLGEFHAMADFCNPGLLDDYNVFRKVYETPILKSRAPDASVKEIEVGEARTTQLLSVAKSFVLRRDASLLKNHLPPKSEFVVFVTPTPLQVEMFSKILHPKKLDDLIQSSTAESLALINILTKLSNSPILLKATADNIRGRTDDKSHSIQQTSVVEALELLPEKANIADMTLSGKFIMLSKILKILRQNTSEKCVLVSHYTSTLNILETYCKKMTYSYFRLDGQTPQSKRQEYVNAFNTGNQHHSFIFLLSSKAGGVGINLIGGSRLFIIDSDWNPSHDLQAMARCHRDGQKRPVYIYRLLTTGAIDEKIYQRQVTKLALSDSLMGSGSASSKSDSFTRKDLRDIFRIHPDTACNTHDLLECTCDSDNSLTIGDIVSEDLAKENDDEYSEMGFVCASDVHTEDLDAMEKAYLQKKKAGLAALSEWNHINCLKSSAGDMVQDDILRRYLEGSTDKLDAEIKPRGRLDTILAEVDIDMIQACSVRDVPGGTISFVFEKTVKSGLGVEDP